MVNKPLLDYMLSFLTPERKERFETILAQRTRHVTVVLEDIYQSHNASAVLRSCDALGIQDVHVIENRNKFQHIETVSIGAGKWLNVHKYNKDENNTKACLAHLKSQGYKIYATTPHTNQCTVSEIPLDEKIALLYGTEGDGLTQEAFDSADEYTVIPMYGFSESFNISVCAALSIYDVTTRLRESDIEWKLTDEEIEELTLEWAKKTIKKSDLIEAEFLNKVE